MTFTLESNKYLRKDTCTRTLDTQQFRQTCNFRIDTQEGLIRLNEILGYILFINTNKILKKPLPLTVLEFNLSSEETIHRIEYPVYLDIQYVKSRAIVIFLQWYPGD